MAGHTPSSSQVAPHDRLLDLASTLYEGVVTLEEAHYRLEFTGTRKVFRDRGSLREGAAADVLVYDMEELEILPNWIGDVEYDLPGGEWRRVQRAAGYDHIIVNGEETFTSGECTG